MGYQTHYVEYFLYYRDLINPVRDGFLSSYFVGACDSTTFPTIKGDFASGTEQGAYRASRMGEMPDQRENHSQDQKQLALQGPLGTSAVRLVPKPTGFRPIVNLGRRIVSVL